MSKTQVKSAVEKLCSGASLEADETRALFSSVVLGELDPVEICAVLIALKSKGETPQEISGAARALVEAAIPLDCGEFAAGTVDTCGTGGDGAGTVNISTAVSLLAAEAGLIVTKHGNRSVSSKCGSADVLESCGIKLETTPEQALTSLREEGWAFLFAPAYHSGMRHAMPVRRKLMTRTIFNLLGPLVNPARPRFQVLGVYHPSLCRPLAETLQLLGCEGALVVHGSGLDELALHGPTKAARLENGTIDEIELTPASVGLKEAPLSALEGGERDENAEWMKELLAGRGSSVHNDAVALNAGAMFWVAGLSKDLAAGVTLAHETLAAGGAAERLERLGRLSQ